MNKAFFGTILFLAACTSAQASKIDPSDDLHCAVALLTLEKNADQLGATLTAKKGLYALQTWFFAKVGKERLGETEAVVEAVKANPMKVASIGHTCSRRAFTERDFSRWMSIASADYDQQNSR